MSCGEKLKQGRVEEVVLFDESKAEVEKQRLEIGVFEGRWVTSKEWMEMLDECRGVLRISLFDSLRQIKLCTVLDTLKDGALQLCFLTSTLNFTIKNEYDIQTSCKQYNAPEKCTIIAKPCPPSES
jgi:hypothetical protein